MRHALLLLTLMLSACDRDRPPAPTAEEAQQLNEAEDLLNQQAAED